MNKIAEQLVYDINKRANEKLAGAMINGALGGAVLGAGTGALVHMLAQKEKERNMAEAILKGGIGGALGGWLFSLFGIGANSWIGELIVAVIGAMVFLWVWNKLLK